LPARILFPPNNKGRSRRARFKPIGACRKAVIPARRFGVNLTVFWPEYQPPEKVCARLEMSLRVRLKM